MISVTPRPNASNPTTSSSGSPPRSSGLRPVGRRHALGRRLQADLRPPDLLNDGYWQPPVVTARSRSARYLSAPVSGRDPATPPSRDWAVAVLSGSCESTIPRSGMSTSTRAPAGACSAIAHAHTHTSFARSDWRPPDPGRPAGPGPALTGRSAVYPTVSGLPAVGVPADERPRRHGNVHLPDDVLTDPRSQDRQSRRPPAPETRAVVAIIVEKWQISLKVTRGPRTRRVKERRLAA
jgi:hypothetical protein